MRLHLTGLWQHPDFMKLWVGQTISEFGSRITRDALPLVAVITLQASPDQMGLLTALSSLPILIFGLYAGVLVDRVRRLPVMLAANILRPLLLLSIPLAALAGTLSIELLYIVAAAVSLLGLIFEIAYRAVLPSLIERKDLVEGNSKLATTDSLAEVGGPAIAGLLVQWIGAPLAIFFDVMSYLAALVSLTLIRKREPEPERKKHAPRDSLRDIAAGWRFLLSDPVLRPLLLVNGTTALFGNFIGPLYALFAIQTLGLNPAQLGLVIASGGIGALLGATLAGQVTKRLALGQTLVIMLLIRAFSVLLIPLADGTPELAMLFLITGQIIGDAASTVYFIQEISLRQSLTPDRMLGRVNASMGFLGEGLAPLGALAAGLLATLSSPRAVLFVAAAGVLLSLIWLIASPVRQLDAMPETVES